MSNIDKMLEITSANQDLFVDLNDKSAETISGGAEVFTIKNETDYEITYSLDGKSWNHIPNANDGRGWAWTTSNGGKGIIEFDQDVRPEFTANKSYDLANGGVYAFRENKTTEGHPWDIELYKIG